MVSNQDRQLSHAEQRNPSAVRQVAVSVGRFQRALLSVLGKKKKKTPVKLRSTRTIPKVMMVTPPIPVIPDLQNWELKDPSPDHEDSSIIDVAMGQEQSYSHQKRYDTRRWREGQTSGVADWEQEGTTGTVGGRLRATGHEISGSGYENDRSTGASGHRSESSLLLESTVLNLQGRGTLYLLAPVPIHCAALVRPLPWLPFSGSCESANGEVPRGETPMANRPDKMWLGSSLGNVPVLTKTAVLAMEGGHFTVRRAANRNGQFEDVAARAIRKACDRRTVEAFSR